MYSTLPPFARAAACVLAALFLSASREAATAATPATNDTCANAMVLPASGPFPYLTPVIDISNAPTNGLPFPDCATNVTRRVWFKFTPAATALYTLSVGADTATTIQDTVMAIYTSLSGCSGPFTAVDCIDDPGPLQAAISTTLTASRTYWIIVWQAEADNSVPLELQLRVTKPAVPANDTCSGALVIPASGPFPYLTTTNDTTLAMPTGTDDPSDTGCAAGYRSLWYRFIPTSSGSYLFTTDASTATTVNDTVMTLYQNSGGCGGTFTVYACNDNDVGRASITTNLVAGTTYYLLVWDNEPDYIPGETSLQLRVSTPPIVTTLAASSVTSTSAVLNAQINPNGLQSRFWFEWGVTTNYTATNIARLVNAGTNVVTTNVLLTGFAPGLIYHFRAVATNTAGKTFGADRTFQTQPILASPERLANGDFRFQFTATPSGLYTVQGSTNLQSPTNWIDLGVATSLGGGVFQFVHPTGAAPYRFYKVRLP